LNPDGSVDTTFLNSASGVRGLVRAIAVNKRDEIFIGGDFTAVNGVAVSGFARLWASSEIQPRITTFHFSHSQTYLGWECIPGRHYRVQYQDNLGAGTWTDLGGDVSGSPNGTAFKTDLSVGSARERFYQVLLLP
jgi:hypothetical protein